MKCIFILNNLSIFWHSIFKTCLRIIDGVKYSPFFQNFIPIIPFDRIFEIQISISQFILILEFDFNYPSVSHRRKAKSNLSLIKVQSQFVLLCLFVVFFFFQIKMAKS